MVWISNGIWNPEAQTFKIQTNGRHFVTNHLKSGQESLDFERSSFQMDGAIALATAKAQTFVNWTIWNLTFKWGKFSSLVANWLSVSGDHGSNPSREDNIFLFRLWVVIPWLLITLKLIHEYAKWSICELIHVWLSIRLKNLKAGYKNNWANKSPFSNGLNSDPHCSL